jgi:hypothetical protein
VCVCVSYHPASGFALDLAVIVGLSDWVGYKASADCSIYCIVPEQQAWMHFCGEKDRAVVLVSRLYA